MDEVFRLLIYTVGAGGAASFITAMFKGWGSMRSGVAQRERARNNSFATRAAAAEKKQDEAEAERDLADDKRREAEEHVAILKYQIRELGAVPRERPTQE